jgi:hypothetical protein
MISPRSGKFFWLMHAFYSFMAWTPPPPPKWEWSMLDSSCIKTTPESCDNDDEGPGGVTVVAANAAVLVNAKPAAAAVLVVAPPLPPEVSMPMGTGL